MSRPTQEPKRTATPQLDVILFTSGSAGDILPFVRVGAALAERGHRVSLVTHSGYDRLAGEAGLRYLPFDTSEQYNAFLRDAAMLNTPSGISRFLQQHSLPRALDALKRITDLASPGSLLLTSPTFDTASRMARDALSLSTLWLFIAPVQVSQWLSRRAVRTAMYSRVLGETIDGIRVAAGMAPVSDWDQWLRYSSRSIGQWPDWFAAPDADWLPGVSPVGFLIDHPAERTPLPSDLADFLNSLPQAPILVTGGTGRYLGREFYLQALEGASWLGLPTLVVTRDRDSLPRSLPPSCLVADKLPFGLVMPRCSAVVHHGGLGTTGAAIAAGVPQLILAFGADRPDNGERVRAAGIGEFRMLPRCESADVAASLYRLTQSDELKARCRQTSARVRRHDAGAAASDLVEAFCARTDAW
jgi:rhamnosyltransferase subunit B